MNPTRTADNGEALRPIDLHGSGQTALGPALVTGADGFIGMALCRRLQSLNVPFIAASDRPGGQSTASILPHLKSLFRPQVVFHLEGSVEATEDGAPTSSAHNPITVVGTRGILKAAVEAGVETFVFFSSCAMMRQGVDEELDETSHPMPTTAFGRAQLVAEGMVSAMDGVQGMRTVSLRPPMVYGPGHRGNLARMIAAIERHWFPPLPDLSGRRSLVHVEDMVDAALTAVERRDAIASRAYFVAEPRAYSSREIYEIVPAALGRNPPRWRISPRVLRAGAVAGDVASRVSTRRLPFNSESLNKLSLSAMYNPRLIERDLGFTTSRSFATSAAEVVSSRGS